MNLFSGKNLMLSLIVLTAAVICAVRMHYDILGNEPYDFGKSGLPQLEPYHSNWITYQRDWLAKECEKSGGTALTEEEEELYEAKGREKNGGTALTEEEEEIYQAKERGKNGGAALTEEEEEEGGGGGKRTNGTGVCVKYYKRLWYHPHLIGYTITDQKWCGYLEGCFFSHFAHVVQKNVSDTESISMTIEKLKSVSDTESISMMIEKLKSVSDVNLTSERTKLAILCILKYPTILYFSCFLVLVHYALERVAGTLFV